MDKRTLIAVALSRVVLITWSYFQKETAPPQNIVVEKETGELVSPPEMEQEKH